MPARFTLGIEEEFQMVDRHTAQLSPHILTILEKGVSQFEDNIKPEMLQSAVEIVTDVCPNITAARLELQNMRKMLLHLLEDEGLTIISAGTHPDASWKDQLSTPNARYIELEEQLQDVVRSILIFGLHVHVGIENHEIAISLMNQLRTWIPHLLAISTNSPFRGGRLTGIKSYRSVIWRPLPRSGVSEPYISWGEFDSYVQSLVEVGIIDNGKKIWWDVRPHPFFPTVEFRVCDMPATFDDTIALAALCQALVAKLSWLYERGLTTPVLPAHFIEENKWRAIRWGLDAEALDFVRGRHLSMRQSISELLDFVDEVLEDLGSRREIDYLRTLLSDPWGTGADHQIALYQRTHSIVAVLRLLMQQTMQGLPEESSVLAV